MSLDNVKKFGLFIFLAIMFSFLAYEFFIKRSELVIGVNYSTGIKGRVRGYKAGNFNVLILSKIR